MRIAIDFDGTCVKHKYPYIGEDIGAVPVLKELVNNGHQLILYTMRSAEHLEAAVQWFKDNNIYLYGVQKDPTQEIWTTSNKCFAQLYIDDAALGCPLIYPLEERAYVDWKKVRMMLMENNILSLNIL